MVSKVIKGGDGGGGDVVDGSGRLTAVMKCYFIVSCI